MKKIELEAFVKSFLLFFLSQTVLIVALFVLEFQKEQTQYEKDLFNQMKLCSFDLSCNNFEIDFVPKKDFEFYKLYKFPNELASFFPISHSSKNVIKIALSKQQYLFTIKLIKQKLLIEFFIVIFFVIVLSVLFSLYALYPYKKALQLTHEFIKDILHDFNTPLATLRLNISMLQKECQSKKLQRIQNSIATILRLEKNLKAYLHDHKLQKERFYIDQLLYEKKEFFESINNHIFIHIAIKKQKVCVNKAALERIIDNLLSNAIKYNDKKEVKIWCTLKNNQLQICDNAKGIQNPSKIFHRYYKEQERGIGLGLHIVKKLCDEIQVPISVSSELKKGSCFYLNIKNIMC